MDDVFGILASLLGGIGLFLLGMRLMTDGLTRAAGPALKSGLELATRSRIRGLLVGILITAIVQSSSAVTVAAIGFANAGLMNLVQSVWVIFGTNVGTTMTGWLVALVGVRIDVGALALPLVGLGMVGWLIAKNRPRSGGLGEAVAGFGAFFLGVGVLQAGFADLAPQVTILTEGLSGTGWEMPAFVLLGIVLTTLTQSSSAAIAIALTAGAGGTLTLEQAAATVVGTNIGTTSTALFAAIGATATAKRVAVMHISFNLLTGGVAFVLLPLLLALAIFLARGSTDTALVLAVFHTLFNVLGVILIWPLTPTLVKFLSHRFMPRHGEDMVLRHLDATLAEVPELAIKALAMELERMSKLIFAHGKAKLAGDPGPSNSLSDVMWLGDEIRGFVDRLNRGTLGPNAVDAISDMLRALQHLDELALAIGAFPPAPEEAVRGIAPTGFALLSRHAAQGCTLLDPFPLQDANARLQELADQSTDTYEAIKAALLRSAASGHAPIIEVEAALVYARAMRDLGQTARKAQKRLMPWRSAPLIGEGNDVQGQG
ncbi:Na/Pi cotransporter family protein [Pelagibacterium lentulum]|nr:Na/Pi symporter [Pelagibacterium lentulum]